MPASPSALPYDRDPIRHRWVNGLPLGAGAAAGLVTRWSQRRRLDHELAALVDGQRR